MNSKPIRTLLHNLAGHLVLQSASEKKNFGKLTRSISQTSLSAEKGQLKSDRLSIEKADLFFEERIPEKLRATLDLLADKKTGEAEEPSFRMFAREVPVAAPLIPRSMPGWAAGARIDHSVGPFQHKDGRQFWFDFYPIEKLIVLYMQGIANPVLLFKVRPRRAGTSIPDLTGSLSRKRSFSLTKGSIWILSRILASNAPAGSYTGLTIRSGTVSFSKQTKVIDDKLTVPAGTTVSVDLKLDQADNPGNPESPYGIDARQLNLQLPKTFAFQFSSLPGTLEEVGNSKWKLYSQSIGFQWNKSQPAQYHPGLQRILIPLNASPPKVDIQNCESVFHTLHGSATVTTSAWALPAASINISQPTPASGTGALVVFCKEGLSEKWQGLEGSSLRLHAPAILAAPGQILLADLTAGSPHAHQTVKLWKDEQNPFGTKVELSFPPSHPFFYISDANGNELISSLTNAVLQVDRPVQVNGEAPSVRSLKSLLMIGVSSTQKLMYLIDDNLLQDTAGDPDLPDSMALAVSNALFKVSGANGCLLFGTLANDYRKMEQGYLFLTFGLLAYIPTLPDPYAANLGTLRRQLRGTAGTTSAAPGTASSITAWLVCRIHWDPPEEDGSFDAVKVSFHFAPYQQQFAGISMEDEDKDENEPPAAGVAPSAPVSGIQVQPAGNIHLSRINTGFSELTENRLTTDAPQTTAAMYSHRKPPRNYEEEWDRSTDRLRKNLFALLDVSTNADLFGISFNLLSGRETSITTHGVVKNSGSPFPVQIEGMEVVSKGQNVRAFTVPQISWEPVLNLTPPQIPGDPPPGVNYYPNDGGPMQIINTGKDSVALAPLPLTSYLLKNFEEDTDSFTAYSFLTLPFGLKALAKLQNTYSYTDEEGTQTRKGTDVWLNAELFGEAIKGGLQIQLNAGEAFIHGESDMFAGSTIQLNNVLDLFGNANGDSTLGRTVTDIFNGEFQPAPSDLIHERGVPLTRIDLSGYGASCFSNWLNPAAAFAQTSQAKFDIIVGRCAHEIIQVKSIIYPWGIKVVRTITIFRVGSGYVYRFDSGWRAESNGEFDFRYFVNITPDQKTEQPSPFAIHPGIVKGLFNVQNIIETDEIAVAEGDMVSEKMVNQDGLYVDNPAADDLLSFKLQPVYFDADIEIENAVSGFNTKKIKGKDKKLVPSKKIIGYVQSAPMGIPVNEQTLRNLVIVQSGSIGGPIDCEVNLAGSGQKMRLNRFDFNNSFGANGSDIVFAVAARGNVLLPKDGSWTMVKHERDSGDVTPVPSNLSVPVIRTGRLIKNGAGQKLDTDPDSVLLRVANPTELLRQPAVDTLNFGFLQSTDTQKALFLTPSFEKGKKKLFSKTPPLFVDAFRIVNSKSIFPNIGNAENDLGDAISLIKNGNEFLKGGLQDIGQDVWELMDVSEVVEGAKQQGYELLKKVTTFDLPDLEFELIDVGDGNFRIYIEYKGKDSNNNDVKGDLDFSINSLANDVADTWKSRMGNIGLVVDLAGIDRLMTIRGSWDSKKGSEASYPQPEIEFSKELQPVIDILEILQQLQGGDYAGAVANGLKLAMSNKAGSWEYKFEATKEIPVLRFPVPDAVYNDPNTPFKLEAGLTIGAYFNAAIQVTNDANELLPSAGGLLGFYGRLSVMCVSLSAATVYAIGQVNLDIAADTKIGPSLRMKFGFGAQVVVGLPVAGNVSVLFVVGVEVFAASGVIELTAFLRFEGHAEILGGLVSITIMIEAKGTVKKKAIGSGSRTDMACQVTFGLDISIFLVINISFSTSWQEQRQIA